MFDFKTFIIKQFTKVKLVESSLGKLTLKVPSSLHVEEEYRWYDEFVARGVKILEGIEDIQFDYDAGTIFIAYNIDKVNEEKVLKWVNTVINVIITNLKLIEEHGENNLDYVINVLEGKLKKEVINI